MEKGHSANVHLPIKLARFTEQDIQQLIGWISSAEFLLQWAGPAFHFPLDQEQLLRHLAQAERPNPDRLLFKAVNPTTDEALGHGELLGIDSKNRSASIARILVSRPELRGQGIGAQIVRQLLKIAFDQLSLHRVALHVFDFNKPAIRCYENVGFKQEGVLREARMHGDQYWNVYVMSILEHEYRQTNNGRLAYE